MNLTNLLVLLLQSGLILGLTLTACLIAKGSPATRLAICRVTLLALIGLLAFRPWLEFRSRPVVPIRLARTVTLFPTSTATVESAATPPPPHAAAVVKGPGAGEGGWKRVDGVAPDPMSLSVRVWQVGSLILTAGLIAGLLSVWQVRRRSRPVLDDRVVGLASALAREASIKMPVVLECPEPNGLFVAGIFRPTIFAPRSLLDSLSEEDLRAVLAHEIAHIKNRDLAWSAVRRLVTIALWWQPLLWLLRKPMEAAAEELCDRHVLATGVALGRYADCLVRLRERAGGSRYPVFAIGAVSGRSSFGARIESILDSSRSKATRLPRLVMAGIIAGTFAVALCAPMVFALPAAPRAPQLSHPGWVNHPYAQKVRVLDVLGRPVRGASAWLIVTGDGPEEGTPLKVSGNIVELTGAAASPQSRGTLVVHAPGFGIGLETLWPIPRELDRVVLGEAHTVSGKVERPDGTPIAGLKVFPEQLFRPNPAAQSFTACDLGKLPGFNLRSATDAAGRFTIHDLPGGTSVSVDHADDRFGSLSGVLRFVTPILGNNPETTIYVHPAAQLTGIVTRNGAPVANIRIGAQDVERDAWAEARSDAHGRYAIKRMRAGIYNVAVGLSDSDAKEVTAAAHPSVALSNGQTVADVNFDLIPGAVVQGRVLDEGGAVLQNVHVGIYGPAHPRTGAWVQTAVTDAAGRYRTRVPAGKQYVYCEDMPEGTGGVEVTVANGSTHTVDIHTRKASARDADAISPAVPAAPPADGSVENHSVDPAPPVRTPPVMSFGPGKPFFGPATLPNGTTVRLAYVQDDFRGPRTPWSPNGSPASATDVARSLNMASFRHERKGAPRSIFLRVDITGAPREDTYCVVEVPHPSNWNPWQTYGDPENRSMDMASFRAPASLQQTDMRFGVAAGAYHAKGMSAMGTPPLFARAFAGPVGPPVTLGGDATVGVTVHFPATLEGKDVRLDAFDRQGNRLELKSWQNDTQVDPKTGARTRSYGFRGASAEDIALVRFTVRDYQWVTFKGIHLYPDAAPERP